jgi:LCP family protein required for cell wall assembly
MGRGRRIGSLVLLTAAGAVAIVAWFVGNADPPTPMSATLPLEGDVAPDGTVVPNDRFALSHLLYGWFLSHPPLKKDLRILLLGFDSAGGGRAGRTDAIMVVEIRPEKRKVGVISIPRDLWVKVPSLADPAADNPESPHADSEEAPGTDSDGVSGFSRINRIYRLGNATYGPGMGHTLLKEVLRTELDLKVDHTVAVDFAGFAEVVDLLGGIDVQVDCPIRDNFVNPDSPTGYEAFFVEAGRRHFDGHRALMYTRSRHGRTDLDRIRRQQAVMMGIRDRALKERLADLPALYTRLSGFINMDMDLNLALSVLQSLRGIGPADIHGLVPGGDMVVRSTTDDGKSVLLLQKEKFMEQHRHLYRAPPPGTRTRGQCQDVNAAVDWRAHRTDEE